MKRSLPRQSLAPITERLGEAHGRFRRRYPGKIGGRQPVHTYYLGAHEFQDEGVLEQIGKAARQSLDEFGPDSLVFARALGLPGAECLPQSPAATAQLIQSIEAEARAFQESNRPAWLAYRVHSRVREKLQAEPIEDLRIDFEDGYGNRSDAEEDGHAESTAGHVAKVIAAAKLPAFFGIRIKPFTAEMMERSIRTLDIFLAALAGEAEREFPKTLLITLAKVSLPEEVSALAEICALAEQTLGIAGDTLRIELMIETTQSVLNEHGEVNILPLLNAGRGRCVAAHFGTYDYTAGRSLAPAYQHMLHPACDFAREMMQVATGGTEIWLSDGGTNVLPVPGHPQGDGYAGKDGDRANESDGVHRGWKLHYRHVRHSLENGFYQGWDLHPAQLPARYAATYSFFLENLDTASERMRGFMERMSEATSVSEVMDDAATGQALLNYFFRALNCGAVTADELPLLTGLTEPEIRSGSFSKILAARRG